MLYTVTFTKYYEYEVEAKDEDKAIEIAERNFVHDMCGPIADTTYVDVDVDVFEESE